MKGTKSSALAIREWQAPDRNPHALASFVFGCLTVGVALLLGPFSFLPIILLVPASLIFGLSGWHASKAGAPHKALAVGGIALAIGGLLLQTLIDFSFAGAAAVPAILIELIVSLGAVVLTQLISAVKGWRGP